MESIFQRSFTGEIIWFLSDTSFKNEYGIQVKMPAKPTFPVEYLFVNVTHGFPNSPDPLFQSHAFPIENRPGLHDQSMEVVVRDLMKILKASDLEVGDTGTWPQRIKAEVAKWLSDYHLVNFLCMQGPFSADEQKLITKAATAHHHPENAMAIEQLFASSGWQTLLTIVESSGAARLDTTAQFDRMGIASPGSGSPSAAASANASHPGTGPASGTGTPAEEAGAGKACPHCTYINEPGATDCDVCGLPL